MAPAHVHQLRYQCGPRTLRFGLTSVRLDRRAAASGCLNDAAEGNGPDFLTRALHHPQTGKSRFAGGSWLLARLL